jgi:hypothetical protein
VANRKKASEAPIRISLRFGAYSDVTLIRELSSLPPFRRAKRARQLLMTGWRMERYGRPLSEDRSPPQTPIAEEEKPTAEGSFENSILHQLGKTVQ